jgi:hypothetical protein
LHNSLRKILWVVALEEEENKTNGD